MGQPDFTFSPRVPLEVDPPVIKVIVTVWPSIEEESEESPSITRPGNYSTEAPSEVS